MGFFKGPYDSMLSYLKLSLSLVLAHLGPPQLPPGPLNPPEHPPPPQWKQADLPLFLLLPPRKFICPRTNTPGDRRDEEGLPMGQHDHPLSHRTKPLQAAKRAVFICMANLLAETRKRRTYCQHATRRPLGQSTRKSPDNIAGQSATLPCLHAYN